MQKQIFIGLLIAVFLLIAGITFVATRADDVLGGGSGIASTTATIDNNGPVIQALSFSTVAYGADDLTSSGILPNIGADRVIHVTGVISDANGEGDIATTTLVFYRSLAASSCSADKNNCYRNSVCTVSAAYGTSDEVAYDCPVTLAYWTDATDTGGRYPSQVWKGRVVVSDLGGDFDIREGDVEVNSLLALTIPTSINYGTRVLGELSTATSNVDMVLTQRGNAASDVEVSGVPMVCAVFGQISTSGQAWALTSVGYASSTQLTGLPVGTGRNIGYRDSESVELVASLYWNIGIPGSGVKGLCTGTDTLAIIANQTIAPEVTAPRVVADGTRSLFVSVTGDVWAWGGGFAPGSYPNGFVRNASSSGVWWMNVDARGEELVHAVNSDGDVYDVTGDIANLAVRADVDSVAEIRGTSGGAIARKTDGTLWARGTNTRGQLGLGDTDPRTNFTQIGTDTDWAYVDAGSNFVLAVKTDGTLWAWGAKQLGSIGLCAKCGRS